MKKDLKKKEEPTSVAQSGPTPPKSTSGTSTSENALLPASTSLASSTPAPSKDDTPATLSSGDKNKAGSTSASGSKMFKEPTTQWTNKISSNDTPAVGKGVGKKGSKTMTMLLIEDTEKRLASFQSELENGVNSVNIK